jgi:hypothetical protein
MLRAQQKLHVIGRSNLLGEVQQRRDADAAAGNQDATISGELSRFAEWADYIPSVADSTRGQQGGSAADDTEDQPDTPGASLGN